MKRVKKILSLVLVGAMLCTLAGNVQPGSKVYASEVDNATKEEVTTEASTTEEATTESTTEETTTEANTTEEVNIVNDATTIEEEMVSTENELNVENLGANIPSVSYYVHVQNLGNQLPVSNGTTAGTVGSSKRLEGIWINLAGMEYTGGVKYTTHVQNYGWRPWSLDGQMSGTAGESKRLEAIKIELYGEVAEHYDIYYRVHAQTYGWLDWAKNGAPAGTASQSKRLEAIQIKLVAKEDTFTESTACSYIEIGKNASGISGLINYRTHVQTYGDQANVCDGSISGTSGESKRLEAIYIALGNTGYRGGVQYKTHVQNKGWLDWVKDGQLSGTSGESKRLEAIQIQLYGEVAEHYDVYYRVHVQSYGWLGWARNGSCAGTAAFSKRLEGIQVMLVPKGSYPGIMYTSSYLSPYYDGNDLGNLSYYDRVNVISNGRGLDNVTKEVADSWQTTITVPTWDFQSRSSMTKVTKMRKLTVNKYIAKHISNMFNEIYNSPDKPIISDGFYCYNYRANVNNTSKLSNHAYGCAIDINPAYNPNRAPGKTYAEWAAMPEGSVAQKQAKAKTIYEGGTIVRVCEKYGLTWGAYYNDSMHFDY